MVGTVIFPGKEVIRIFLFSVGTKVLWTILLVFVIASIVSFIIDVGISVKEIVFKSDSFISVEGKAFSLVETDCVELSGVTLVVSLNEEVVSIIGLVFGILIKVVSILEVLNSDSRTLVVDWDLSSKKLLSNSLVSGIMKVVGLLNIVLLKSVNPSVSSGI